MTLPAATPPSPSWDETANALLVMDADGRILEWPQTAESVFGFRRSEALGRLAASLLITDPLRDNFHACLERLTSSDSQNGPALDQRLEIAAHHKSGEEIVIDLTLTRVKIQETLLLLGQVQNLSSRIKHEEDSSRERIESQLLNHVAALSSVEDSFHESLQKCLDTLCTITGWPLGFALLTDPPKPRLLTGKLWHIANDEELAGIKPEQFQIQVPKDKGFIGHIWRTGEPSWTSEWGEDDPLMIPELLMPGFQMVFGFPVIADEEIIAILVFFDWQEMIPNSDMLMVIDNLRHQLGRMVERKRWIEERARLAAIVDSSYDAIIGKDLSGRIITWNQGAEQVYGYQGQEVLGKSVRMLLPLGMEEEEASVTDVVATGHRLNMFETKRRCKDGTIIDVALTVSPIRDSRGRIVGSSSIERDVTLRKRKDKELLQAKREAEQANRAKSEFLANISHELRTPMNAILGMLHLSLGEDLSEPLDDYLKTAHESAQTLLYLLNDLLDFSRMSAGHLELENEPFRLRETLDMAIKSLSLRASEKGLELACHISKFVPNALKGDAVRLRQIIVNLAGNAIKFTDQGEVVLNVNVQSQSNNQVALRFSVRDTGIGIPKQHQEKIFAPFTQVDASTTRNETGSGLGLAIVRELVGKMGGTIGLESEAGQGSHFYFTVPFEVLLDSRISQDSKELNDLRVLVVDDNRTNRVILEETLATWRMSPTVVASAKSALKAIQEAEVAGQPFPLIIVDALMPEMDGFMLVEKINESRHDSASPMMVLMLSSADRQTFKQRCENLKVAAYLEKPVSQSMLLDTLMTVLKGPLLSRKSYEQVKPLPQGLSILVAEDTPANQKVIRAILEKRGHHVQIANNGREAVDQVTQHQFDVVLMDVQMPTMDGLQATQTIRNLSNPKQADIPIVAMTAHARREDRRKCLSSGMDAYIAKPIDAGKLIHLVENVERREDDYRASETWESDFVPLSTALINVESAKARMGGNEPLVVDLARFFLEDAPKLVKDIENALRAGQAEEVERAAHSLKGLAANFDAETLTTLALIMEEQGRNGKIEKAKRQFSELKAAARNVCREIQAYVDSHKTSDS